ncbi:MAG TPA: nuclear transport factor 2 family protein, partial [Solirubrobacterales bacterium]|nr:nuclear transport factor 2 family protein [Solirubrobacterales bacterium]
MSRENVEVVRRVMTEFTGSQRLTGEVAPDLIWDLSSWDAWTGQPEYHGHDGFYEFFAEWTDAYEEWTQEPQSFIDAGADKVVVATIQRGRLRGSDSWAELRAGFLYSVDDGLITHGSVFASPEEALEAAGLR